MTYTLGDALPREMARVRDVVMPVYIKIGPSGQFGLAMMRADLDAAAKAMAEGDVIGMMRAYVELKDYTLMTPFIGTQAQLADEFLRRSQSCQQISADSDPEYRMGWDIPANVWKLAAALVRNAKITEDPTP